jgi:hypothetical protein
VSTEVAAPLRYPPSREAPPARGIPPAREAPPARGIPADRQAAPARERLPAAQPPSGRQPPPAGPRKPSRSRLPSLTGLRICGSVAVVLCHVGHGFANAPSLTVAEAYGYAGLMAVLPLIVAQAGVDTYSNLYYWLFFVFPPYRFGEFLLGMLRPGHGPRPAHPRSG